MKDRETKLIGYGTQSADRFNGTQRRPPSGGLGAVGTQPPRNEHTQRHPWPDTKTPDCLIHQHRPHARVGTASKNYFNLQGPNSAERGTCHSLLLFRCTSYQTLTLRLNNASPRVVLDASANSLTAAHAHLSRLDENVLLSRVLRVPRSQHPAAAHVASSTTPLTPAKNNSNDEHAITK